MAGKVIELNDTNFEDQIKEGIVLVDFWAPWCGPCRSQVPIIEALAEKVDGKALIAKLNVDEAASAAGKFNVMSIPTLIVFKDGAEAERFVGVQSEEKLLEAMGLS